MSEEIKVVYTRLRIEDVKWRTYTPMKWVPTPVRFCGSTSRFRK